MKLEIVGEIKEVETIAEGNGIRDIANLRRRHGLGRWRKKKGAAQVRLADGSIVMAEVHWYEAHGIGRVKFKIKAWL